MAWKLACNEEIPPAVRLSACKAIMYFSLRGFDVMGLAPRLEALEAELSNRLKLPTGGAK